MHFWCKEWYKDTPLTVRVRKKVRVRYNILKKPLKTNKNSKFDHKLLFVAYFWHYKLGLGKRLGLEVIVTGSNNSVIQCNWRNSTREHSE
jgi:hypothetical protein